MQNERPDPGLGFNPILLYVKEYSLLKKIDNNWREIKQSLFFRKFLVVMSGTLVAQLISLVATPFITRLYTPEAFGYFSNVVSLAAVFASLLTLSFSLAIVLPKKENNALALTQFTLFLALILAVILILVLQIVNIGSYIQLGKVSVYEIVFYSYLLAVFEILTYWLIRKEHFSFRSKMFVLQAVVIVSLKLSIGFFYPDEAVLLYSTIVGVLLVNLIVLYFSGVSVRKWGGLRGVVCAKKYSDIAKFRTPQNLFANFNQLLPIMMLTYFYSAEVAGMYALAKTVLLLPGNLIAKSIVDVLYPDLCKKYNEYKEIGRSINKSMLMLSVLGLIPLIVVFFFGKYLFSFVFGDSWVNSGEYAQWLCIWLYFNFINKPYITLIPILKMEKVFLKNSMLNTILSMLGLYLGFYLFNDASYSILFFSLFTIIPQLIIIITVRKRIIEHDHAVKLK
jgi:O-antigen/teichoic acid export membrane protein